MRKTVAELEKKAEKTNGFAYVELAKRIGDCKASVRAAEAVVTWIKRHALTAGKIGARAIRAKGSGKAGRGIGCNPP